MDGAKIGANAPKVLFGVDNIEELRKRYPGKHDVLLDEICPRAKVVTRAGATLSFSIVAGISG